MRLNSEASPSSRNWDLFVAAVKSHAPPDLLDPAGEAGGSFAPPKMTTRECERRQLLVRGGVVADGRGGHESWKTVGPCGGSEKQWRD